MARRSFNLAALSSAVLLGFTVILCFMSLWLNPPDHHVSFGDSFHIGVSEADGDDTIGRLVFYNTEDPGPYYGSLIQMFGPSTLLSEAHFGDTAGIYFRYFRWPPGVLWTLMISLWYPLILFSIQPAIWLILNLRSRTHPGFCPKCQYDLRASAGQCPECGTEISSTAANLKTNLTGQFPEARQSTESR